MPDTENNFTETEESAGIAPLGERLLHRAKQAIQGQLSGTHAKLNAEVQLLRDREAVLAQAAGLLNGLANGRKTFADHMGALNNQASDEEGARIEQQLANEFTGTCGFAKDSLDAFLRWQTLRALRPRIETQMRIAYIERREADYAGAVAKNRDAMKAAGFPLKA